MAAIPIAAGEGEGAALWFNRDRLCLRQPARRHMVRSS
jgi:hypothetical protein